MHAVFECGPYALFLRKIPSGTFNHRGLILKSFYCYSDSTKTNLSPPHIYLAAPQCSCIEIHSEMFSQTCFGVCRRKRTQKKDGRGRGPVCSHYTLLFQDIYTPTHNDSAGSNPFHTHTHTYSTHTAAGLDCIRHP